MRVEVGPPEASIGSLIFDPPDGREPRATIMVLHGVGDGPFWMRGKARTFAAHGYRAVLVGLRGYGESTGDFRSFVDIARTLKARLGDAARRVPTRQLPDFLVRLVALFDKSASLITPELGVYKNATSDKAQRLLAWKPRSADDALVATAESLLALGLLKDSKQPAS